MNRLKPLFTIAGIAIAICAAIVALHVTKSQGPLDRSAEAAQAQAKRGPFRSVVVELTFQSRSTDNGEETLSATGHRTEYIDVAGGRRREEYSSNNTIVGGQLPSQQSVTWIFDGTHFYGWIDKDGKRTNRMADTLEKYDSPIWADAAVEQQKLQGATLSGQEEVLGHPCKVYTQSFPGLVTRKWWVWNGVTLRSEMHWDRDNSITDTSEEAVRAEEDVDIDPSLFKPPDTVTFELAKPTPARQADRHAPWVRMGPEIELFWF